MPVEPVSAVSGRYTQAPVRAPKQEMDGEMFLNLLVTQLRYQDPSSPMDTNAMISQTTELAMMEQLTAMSTSMNESFGLQMRTAAAEFLGHEVTYFDADGSSLTGTATAVSYAGSVPMVTVNGLAIPLDQIAGLTAAPAAAPTAPSAPAAPAVPTPSA